MSSKTKADGDFSDAVSELVLTHLGQRPASFRWLTQHLDGAFPAEIHSCLQRLISDNTVRFTGGCFFLNDRSTVACQDESARRFPPAVEGVPLPLPHPADYDWRFVPHTSRLLARLAVRLSQGRPVALFGAPTVYAALANSGAAAFLYERNADMVQALPQTDRAKVIEADLLGFADVPQRSYGVVVADPPWYPEYYLAFAQHAASALTEQGFLVLSLLPRLARPGASTERRDILESLFQLGFDLFGYHKAKLWYRTPPFEEHSLRAEGLECGDWRRGDLGVFQLARRTSTREFLLPLRVDEPLWEGFRVGGRQFKVRIRPSDPAEPFSFEPLGQHGPTLPTVSRRHLIRERIDVWSELNEAWEVSRVDVAREVLRNLNGGTRQVEPLVDDVAKRCGLNGDDATRVHEFVTQLLAQSPEKVGPDGNPS